MKTAILADLHIRGKDLHDFNAQADQCLESMSSRGVVLVIIAGDVFDSSNVGDQYVATGGVGSTAIRFVSRLCEVAVAGVRIIRGNHDQSGAGSSDALGLFDGIPRVRTFSKPTIEHILGVDIAYFPWQWGADVEAELKFFDRPVDLFIGHIQVIGAVDNDCNVYAEKPGSWQISADRLKSLPVRKVALGDFHRRQGPYVGAFRQINYGEQGNPCGFEIWDSASNKSEWIELDAAPTYRTIRADYYDESMKRKSNEYLKLKVGKPIDAGIIKVLESDGIIVEPIIEKAERIQRAEVPDGVLNDPHELIRLWAKSQEPPIEGDRLSKMLTVFDEMYAEEICKK